MVGDEGTVTELFPVSHFGGLTCIRGRILLGCSLLFCFNTYFNVLVFLLGMGYVGRAVYYVPVLFVFRGGAGV